MWPPHQPDRTQLHIAHVSGPLPNLNTHTLRMCDACDHARHVGGVIVAASFSYQSHSSTAHVAPRSTGLERPLPPSFTSSTHVQENMARLSGLQKDVLSFYRQCLRALKEKPDVCTNNRKCVYDTNPFAQDTRLHFRNFARFVM